MLQLISSIPDLALADLSNLESNCLHGGNLWKLATPIACTCACRTCVPLATTAPGPTLVLGHTYQERPPVRAAVPCPPTLGPALEP